MPADQLIHSQRSQQKRARGPRAPAQPVLTALRRGRRLLIGNHQLAPGRGRAQQLRRVPRERHHGLLPLTGMLVLFVLRQLAGRLLQRHRAGRNRLVNLLCPGKLLKQLRLAMGKRRRRVHLRPSFPSFGDGCIVPFCGGFVN